MVEIGKKFFWGGSACTFWRSTEVSEKNLAVEKRRISAWVSEQREISTCDFAAASEVRKTGFWAEVFDCNAFLKEVFE